MKDQEPKLELDKHLLYNFARRFDGDFGRGVKQVTVEFLPDGRQVASYFGPSGDCIVIDPSDWGPIIALPLGSGFKGPN